ncbi:DUF4012 domain-containing protein [Pseudarthrobacter sp. N5]|uniref:DUF4012 domain-containing protein n=1 Tax=Pseudarthrobacter sp. N5 TaxID=3418416 RepID=UPI003CEFC5A6
MGCLVFGAWAGIKGSTVRTELSAAFQLLPQLKNDISHGDADAAKRTVQDLRAHTAKARDAASDPVWTLAGTLPWIGANVQAANEVATSADDVAKLGAAPLVSVFQSLDWKTLAPSGEGINLDPMVAAKPKILASAHAVRQSSDRLNAIDADTLLPEVSVPLIQARNQLDSLRDGLDAASDAASIAPEMLGGQTPRRYLLLIQNNAEARATGGIPGALAIVSIDKGKLSLGSQSSAAELGDFVPPITVDAEQEQLYSTRIGKYMQDVNLTPDFPTAASTAKDMWERKTGEHVDGVISIDPVALGYILDVTGPVGLTDPALKQQIGTALPAELTGKNIVPTLLSDVYAKIAKPQLQDAYFAGVAKEIFGALSSGKGDDKALVDGVAKGAGERRILLWSASGEEQKVIANYPLGGSIAGASVSPAQFGVYFNDGTGAKMDYYVKRTVQLVEECTIDQYSQIKVRVTSTNTAPLDAATSLPAYVTGDGNFGVPAGTVQSNVVVYGPVQAQVETAAQDGKKVAFGAQHHGERPVGTVTTMLAPGQSHTDEITFSKIVQRTEPNVVVTPTVQAVKEVVLNAEPAHCTRAK